MPLWAAALLLLLCAAGTAWSFYVYIRGGGKKFLSAGITLSLLSVAALLYAGAAIIFVSSIP